MKTDSIDVLRDIAQRLTGTWAEMQGPAQQAVMGAQNLLDSAGTVSDDAALQAIIERAEESLNLVSCPIGLAHLAANQWDEQATENKELVACAGALYPPQNQ